MRIKLLVEGVDLWEVYLINIFLTVVVGGFGGKWGDWVNFSFFFDIVIL